MPKNRTADPFVREVSAELARNGLKQRDLARVLNLSPPALSRRFTGEVPFDTREVRVISRFLAVPIGQLFGEPQTKVAAAGGAATADAQAGR